MTIADLAKAASLSVGMLSKIENGQTSASLSTLQSLAQALNIPIATFFAKFDEKSEATHVKAGRGLAIERRGSRKGHLYQLLGHGLRSSPKVEPFLITLDDQSDAYPIFQHPGTEFIYLLEGVMDYSHSRSVYRLHPGDSLQLDGEGAHGPVDLVELPIRFLSVVAFPDSQV